MLKVLTNLIRKETTVEKLQPIKETERLELIDIIRGIAIFGILLVNMAHFSYPDMYIMYLSDNNFIKESWHVLDHITRWLLDVFVQGKFITMFSFLFGFGMVMMMERAQRKELAFVPLFTKRLIALLVFGIIHAFFIWDGDILMDYAVLGFILLLFRHCKPKTLIIWALSLFALYSLILSAIGVLSMTFSNEEVFGEEFILSMEREALQAYDMYQNGTVMEVFAQRIHDRLYYMDASGMWPFNPLMYLLFMIPYFSMFLLGAAFHKLRIFQNRSKHRSLMKRVLVISLIIGLPINLLSAYEPSFVTVGGPFLMLVYVMSIALLVDHQAWKLMLKPFASVGRTAFSNYIFQSIICTTLFYSYGFGLYGKVNPFLGIWISILIFILQVVLSKLWLRNYRMGPLEWVWRTITYGEVQPLKRVEKMN